MKTVLKILPNDNTNTTSTTPNVALLPVYYDIPMGPQTAIKIPIGFKMQHELNVSYPQTINKWQLSGLDNGEGTIYVQPGAQVSFQDVQNYKGLNSLAKPVIGPKTIKYSFNSVKIQDSDQTQNVFNDPAMNNPPTAATGMGNGILRLVPDVSVTTEKTYYASNTATINKLVVDGNYKLKTETYVSKGESYNSSGWELSKDSGNIYLKENAVFQLQVWQGDPSQPLPDQIRWIAQNGLDNIVNYMGNGTGSNGVDKSMKFVEGPAHIAYSMNGLTIEDYDPNANNDTHLAGDSSIEHSCSGD